MNNLNLAFYAVGVMGSLVVGILVFMVLDWMYETREAAWRRSRRRDQEEEGRGKSESAGHG